MQDLYPQRCLKIGTRASPLARRQTEIVQQALAAAHPEYIKAYPPEIIPMTTSGDKLLHTSLVKEGGKGLFIKEIELALHSGEIDIAVHSLKDVPVPLLPEFELAAYLPRTSPHDVFIHETHTLLSIPKGSRIGTSSIRRKLQTLQIRPDLEIVSLRGNIETRLQKWKNGEVDALILAAAGLERMEYQNYIRERLSVETHTPSPGQGVIVIEIRKEARFLLPLLQPLNDEPTKLCVELERDILLGLEGSCQVPVGVYATLENQHVMVKGFYADALGSHIVQDTFRVNKHYTKQDVMHMVNTLKR